MKTIGEYKLSKFLGKGSYGEIYLAEKPNDPKLYAAKIYDRKQMDMPLSNKFFKMELEIAGMLNHPNIAKFYDKLEDESHYYLIHEYCNGGNLTECIKKYQQIHKEPFSIEIIQHFMIEIISAFCHIHSKKIIHRDIKLDNILLSYDNETDKNNFDLMKSSIKIIDFGVATKLGPDGKAYYAIGTPLTMAPLILKKYANAGGAEKLMGYNEKADIWSLGTIFYQLLTGNHLFTGKDLEDLVKKVDEGNYKVPINKNFSKESISFLNCMLQYNPEDRISVQDLAQHDFITKSPSTFHEVDLKKIFHKIDKNELKINTKKNETIVKVLNASDEKNPNPFSKFDPKDPNVNQLKKAHTYQEEGYSWNGDIWSIKRYADVNQFTIQDLLAKKNLPKLDEPLRQSHRFAAGNVSPSKNINQNKELTKIEEEIKETEKIEEEKKKTELIKKNEEKKLEEKKQEEKKNNPENKKNNNIGEREEALLYIKGLLEEYKSVKEYFKKWGFFDQEKDAIEKYYKVENLLQSFEKGNSISFEALPKPISPEYLYGCSISDREAVFQDILNDFIQRKNDSETIRKNLILTYKNWDRDSFLLVKNKVMEKFERENANIEKCRNGIKLVEEKKDNKWIPQPKIEKNMEVRKTEKFNYDNCIFKTIIHMTKINYYNSSNNFIIRLSLKINEEKTFTGRFQIKNYGNFEDDIIWNLNNNEWNNLSEYFINVEFYLDKVLKGKQIIKIDRLKDEPNFNIKYPISFLAQPKPAIINLNIKVEMPLGKKYIRDEIRQIIKIKNSYPPFEGKSPLTSEIPRMFLK